MRCSLALSREGYDGCHLHPIANSKRKQLSFAFVDLENGILQGAEGGHVVMAIYSETRTAVRTGAEDTGSLGVNVSVRQGLISNGCLPLLWMH